MVEIAHDVNNLQVQRENPTLKMYKLFTSVGDREGCYCGPSSHDTAYSR